MFYPLLFILEIAPWVFLIVYVFEKEILGVFALTCLFTSMSTGQNIFITPRQNYIFYLLLFVTHLLSLVTSIVVYVSKVSKGAKIRNRYNQVPHLTQDT